MRIPQHFAVMPGMTSHPVKQGAAKQAAALSLGGAMRPSSRDTLSLSPFGRASSALSGMEKLRQQIEDRRSEFLAKAAEKGQSADAIQSELDSFDQQLKDIDRQIAQMTIQQMNQRKEQAKHISNMSAQQPKTRQEVENKQLAAITSMSAGLDQANVMHTVQSKVDGDIRIQKSEITLEKSRGGDVADMEAELSELQSHSSQLTARIHGQLQETLAEIQESNDQTIHSEIVDPEESEEKDHKDDLHGGKVEEEHVSLKSEAMVHSNQAEHCEASQTE